MSYLYYRPLAASVLTISKVGAPSDEDVTNVHFSSRPLNSSGNGLAIAFPSAVNSINALPHMSLFYLH